MSEEKKSWGFYFQPRRKDEPKKHTETHAEEAIASSFSRTFVKEFTMAALEGMKSMNADGTPSELIEGALGMYMFDLPGSRFSGNLADRRPIMPSEVVAKEEAIHKYAVWKAYLGADHPYTQKWYNACIRILHNHATRGTNSKALEFKTFIPWDIQTKGPGQQNVPKKDALEAD